MGICACEICEGNHLAPHKYIWCCFTLYIGGVNVALKKSTCQRYFGNKGPRCAIIFSLNSCRGGNGLQEIYLLHRPMVACVRWFRICFCKAVYSLIVTPLRRIIKWMQSECWRPVNLLLTCPSLSLCTLYMRWAGLCRIDSLASHNPTTVLSHVLKAELDKISCQIDKVPDGCFSIQIYESPLHYRAFCCKLLFFLAALHSHAHEFRLVTPLV